MGGNIVGPVGSNVPHLCSSDYITTTAHPHQPVGTAPLAIRRSADMRQGASYGKEYLGTTIKILTISRMRSIQEHCTQSYIASDPTFAAMVLITSRKIAQEYSPKGTSREEKAKSQTGNSSQASWPQFRNVKSGALLHCVRMPIPHGLSCLL